MTRKDEMVYIPLLATLERLLNNEDVLNQVCLLFIKVWV